MHTRLPTLHIRGRPNMMYFHLLVLLLSLLSRARVGVQPQPSRSIQTAARRDMAVHSGPLLSLPNLCSY